MVKSTGKGNFDMEIDGRDCTVFVDNVMDQWHLVIITAKSEIFKAQRQQLFLSILVSVIVFTLISVFYFVGYKNERNTNIRMEEMKVNEQRKDYEAKVLKLEKTAADIANKAKSDFLADMSHEIRTPINAVLGMNEMILRKSDDEKILDYASNIKSAGNTLLSIINTILDFSKIEDGKMELVPVEFTVNDLTHNLVNTISERAKAKGLELKVDIDETLPSKLYGDDVRISQVIMNLLTNAVKYTEKGSVTLCIRKKEIVDDNLIFY
ncbi:MAG: histidine kinase, partial [Lachnospiraceae bacterium]|nr:histidine kinase [Lachnospiraceae bacterium]